MIDVWWDVVIPAVSGAAAAVAYLYGLWWTLMSLPRTRRPGTTLWLGFLVRTLLVAACLVAVSGGRPIAVAVALTAFWLARQGAMAHFTRRLPGDVGSGERAASSAAIDESGG